MNEEKQRHEAYLASQLKQLKKKEAKDKKGLLNVKLANHGEWLRGMWSALSKEKRPRNPIHRIKILNTNPPQYERHLKRMVEIARNHHEKLQDEDIEPDINIVEYNARLNECLNEIPENQRLEEPE